MKIFTLLMLLLFGTHSYAENRLVIPVHTVHMSDNPDYEYNDRTIGLGYEHKADNIVKGIAVTKNSYDETSYVGYFGYESDRKQDINFGAAVIAASGYEKVYADVIVYPAFTIKYKNFRIVTPIGVYINVQYVIDF
jgi:hypothetical protein